MNGNDIILIVMSFCKVLYLRNLVRSALDNDIEYVEVILYIPVGLGKSGIDIDAFYLNIKIGLLLLLYLILFHRNDKIGSKIVF